MTNLAGRFVILEGLQDSGTMSRQRSPICVVFDPRMTTKTRDLGDPALQIVPMTFFARRDIFL